MDLVLIGTLMAVIIYQGVMNHLQHRQIQTLINKVMSRDYTDYTTNQAYQMKAKIAPTLEEAVEEYRNRETYLPVT